MTRSRMIPLRQLSGEIIRVRYSESLILDGLRFVCPVCLGLNGTDEGVHSHLIPFEFQVLNARSIKDPRILVWGHESGFSVEDLTLTPSYLSTSQSCVVHVFIRNGLVEVLPDSKLREPSKSG